MLSDEELEKLYFQEFPLDMSIPAVSSKLKILQSTHLDDFRHIFCNRLLYILSAGYTQYSDTLPEDLVLIFCENADLLKENIDYFQAAANFFRHNEKKCLIQLKAYLKSRFQKYPNDIIDEYLICDCLLEPFKEAFPGFWSEMAKEVRKYPYNPGIPELCEIIGRYYATTSSDEALNLLLTALQKWPDSIILKELTGYTYYELKMWKNAVAMFESVEDTFLLFPDDLLYFMMAWCYGQVKERHKEERYYRKSLEIVPNEIYAINNLAYCLYGQKKYSEAKTLLEHCLALAPKFNLSSNNYVRVLIALHRYKDAQDFVGQGYPVSASLRRKVKSLDPTNARLHKVAVVEPLADDSQDEEIIQLPRTVLPEKGQQFSNEKLLEDELTARIESGIEVFGMKLKIFRRKGLYGRQFIIPIGRLDLLCEDDKGDLFVIELKKDAGYDDAYLQTSQYLDWFEHSEYAKDRNIYGIICLNSPSQNLIEKVHSDPRMKLFEYQISYTER